MDAPVQPTLKEKLKRHYNERDFTVSPKRANLFGVLYSIYFMLGGYIYAMIYAIPTAHDSAGNSIVYARIFASIVFFQLTFNWFMCARKYLNAVPVIKDNSSGEMNEGIGSEQQPQAPLSAAAGGWRHCAVCRVSAPPRSYHCRLCKACMLKQDHHCYFAGGCIGFHTQRYFVSLVLWTVIANAYCLYLAYHCVGHMLPPATLWSAYILIFTLIQYMLNHVTSGEALAVLHLYLIFVNLFVALMYLSLQAICLTRNQTLFEGTRGITRYNVGLWENMRSSLGGYWLLGFFLPIWRPLQGDGYHFATVKQLKGS